MKTLIRAASALVLFTFACGGNDQADARDRATTQTCNQYKSCGEIGPSQLFPNQDECLVQKRNFWDSTWLYAQCEGKIHSAAVDNCVNAIKAVSCANFSNDYNSVVATQCSIAQVCNGR